MKSDTAVSATFIYCSHSRSARWGDKQSSPGFLARHNRRRPDIPTRSASEGMRDHVLAHASG